MFNSLKQMKLITNIRKTAKILADNRKSHHPIETLSERMTGAFYGCKKKTRKNVFKLGTWKGYHLSKTFFCEKMVLYWYLISRVFVVNREIKDPWK